MTKLPSYEEALRDPVKARQLFDASKGGNVRGITEDHRYQLTKVMQAARAPLPSASQVHIFDQMRVRTTLQPNGQYTAVDADNYDVGSPMGWASTRFGAIADLADQLRERGELEG